MKTITLSDKEYDQLCTVLNTVAGCPPESMTAQYVCKPKLARALFDALTLEGLGLHCFNAGRDISQERWEQIRQDARQTIEAQ